jgi:hypothetical protein
MINFKINIDSRGLSQLQQQISAQLNGQEGPLHNALMQCEARYVGAMRKRFVQNSRGGGDWPPLAESTLLARAGRPVGRVNLANEMGDLTATQFSTRSKVAKRKARLARKKIRAGTGKASILWDTGELINVLSAGNSGVPGKYFEFVNNGIRTGFGGPATHAGSNATIADIAAFHQEGGGNLPKREILVEPGADVIASMSNDFQRGIEKLIKDAQK